MKPQLTEVVGEFLLGIINDWQDIGSTGVVTDSNDRQKDGRIISNDAIVNEINKKLFEIKVDDE